MKSLNRWKTAIATCAVLPFLASPALAAGGKSLGKDSGVHPATLQDIPGSDIRQVTITARAAERLDLHTSKVAEKMGQRVVPYASIIYDPTAASGSTRCPRTGSSCAPRSTSTTSRETTSF